VADGRETDAIVVFGLMSLLGLFLTVIQIYITVTRISPFNKHPHILGALLSYACTWGAILGVRDLVTMVGVLFPPSIILATVQALSMESVALTLGVGSLISVLVLLVLKKQHY
jgi:hypothetical protein